MKRLSRSVPHSPVPTVNLLSPWVFEALAVRRLRLRFTAAAGVVVLLVGVAWGIQHLRAGHAERVLTIEQAETARLTAAAAELAPVRTFVVTVDQQKALVSTTMEREVYVSRVLSGLTASTPPGAEFETVAVTIAPPLTPEEEAAAAAAGTGSACPGPDPFNTRVVVGCVLLTGSADSRASVGDLVVNLGNDALFVEPFISTTTTAEGDDVVFTGSVGLSKKAFSDRYADIDTLLAQEARR